MTARSHLARFLLGACVAFVLMAGGTGGVAAADRLVAKARAIYAPVPEVPEIARARKLRGSGVFLCHVRREDGSVWKVGILRSTGHESLDAAAARTLAKWRFQPHTVTSVRIPITYGGNYQ